MKNLVFIIFSILLISCKNEKVNTKFIEIKNNVARFDIKNNSNRDIYKITFEIKFIDKSENVLLLDTISYQMRNESNKVRIPFLRANDITFIAQIIPINCEKADIRVLNMDYIMNN